MRFDLHVLNVASIKKKAYIKPNSYSAFFRLCACVLLISVYNELAKQKFENEIRYHSHGEDDIIVDSCRFSKVS